MRTLSLNTILYIHQQTIAKHGGLEGIRDINSIRSALETPFLTFNGEDLNKTTLDKISALTYSIIKNHCFRDGNKRVGTIVMGVLCELNNIKIECPQEELINFGLNVADGKMLKSGIKDWIIEHTVSGYEDKK